MSNFGVLCPRCFGWCVPREDVRPPPHVYHRGQPRPWCKHAYCDWGHAAITIVFCEACGKWFHAGGFLKHADEHVERVRAPAESAVQEVRGGA